MPSVSDYFSDLDFFGMWVWGPEPHGPAEKIVYEEYTDNAYITGCDWMPFFQEEPWTAELRGKNVLVISPFADTITKQYENHKIPYNSPETPITPKELLLFSALGEKVQFLTTF